MCCHVSLQYINKRESKLNHEPQQRVPMQTSMHTQVQLPTLKPAAPQVGTSPAAGVAAWCQKTRTAFDVQPGKSWGGLSAGEVLLCSEQLHVITVHCTRAKWEALQAKWKSNDCDTMLAAATGMVRPGSVCSKCLISVSAFNCPYPDDPNRATYVHTHRNTIGFLPSVTSRTYIPDRQNKSESIFWDNENHLGKASQVTLHNVAFQGLSYRFFIIE